MNCSPPHGVWVGLSPTRVQGCRPCCAGPELTWFDHMLPKTLGLSVHACLGAKRHCWGRGFPVPRLSPPSTALPLISST